MGVRTRDQYHLIRQPHHRSPDRMCTCDPLKVYIKKNKAVIGLETEPNHSKRYNVNLCLFRCLVLHRGCDLNRLVTVVKTLYETYDQDAVRDIRTRRCSHGRMCLGHVVLPCSTCSKTFRRRPTSRSSTRRIKIFITSSKIT